MSYRALYRVWRPQRFDELVGQPVISKTLKNAIMTKQVSHAYLFAGPRGTGKTSTAKILAKAVNCPHQKDGEPCNKCHLCQAITKGELDDVIEIDAASNNGVDEIRNIRDKARYAPTQAPYKVYIIDEVHMLSTGAFNALLKTLEEPPAHVIFIMATTEPQKIPATIISRIQRFNFRRIPTAEILQRLEQILKHDQCKYDEKGLQVIAQSAEGGMRDALSILDEVLSYGKDQVTYKNVLQVTGQVTQELLAKYVQAIFKHDVKPALMIVQKLLQNGKDANQFVETLINYAQDLLLYQQSPEMLKRQELGIVDQHFTKMAQTIPAEWLYQAIEQTSSIEQQMRFTVHPEVYLEVLTVRIANLSAAHSAIAQKLAKLTQQVQDLKKQLQTVKEAAKQRPVAAPVHSQAKAAASHPSAPEPPVHHHNDVPVRLEQVNAVLQGATAEDLQEMKQAWRQVMRTLPMTQKAILDVAKPVAASKKGLVVAFAYDFFYERAMENHELVKALQMGLDQIIGRLPQVALVPNSQWPKISQQFLAQRNQPTATSSQAQPKESQADSEVAKATSQAVKWLGPNIKPYLKIKKD